MQKKESLTDTNGKTEKRGEGEERYDRGVVTNSQGCQGSTIYFASASDNNCARQQWDAI